MMKTILFCLLFVLAAAYSQAQTNIHSHNDYSQPHPLTNAIESRAWSIEVDVFLVKGDLLIGHSLKETSRKKTLQKIYLHPITNLFKQHKGQLSADPQYAPHLVIDIKQNGPEVLKALVEVLEPLRNYFDRSVNPKAVQIIISGDRGPIELWKDYPPFIQFDGRPYEIYDQNTLDKIAMISDNYFNYIETRTNRGDSLKIKQVVSKAHAVRKPMRFWGSPDNEAIWKFLVQCGAEILNTDKPKACRNFLEINL